MERRREEQQKNKRKEVERSKWRSKRSRAGGEKGWQQKEKRAMVGRQGK